MSQSLCTCLSDFTLQPPDVTARREKASSRHSADTGVVGHGCVQVRNLCELPRTDTLHWKSLLGQVAVSRRHHCLPRYDAASLTRSLHPFSGPVCSAVPSRTLQK